MDVNKLIISFLLLSSLATLSLSSPTDIKAVGGEEDDNQCMYTLYIQTGTLAFAGTNSVISLTLKGKDGLSMEIRDLPSWGGMMPSKHNYFEFGNLDIFSGRGPCLSSAPCWMNLTSDGSGYLEAWYCNYVQVTTTGPLAKHCSQQLFTVKQWLSIKPPLQPFAVRNNCGVKSHEGSVRHLGRRGAQNVM